MKSPRLLPLLLTAALIASGCAVGPQPSRSGSGTSTTVREDPVQQRLAEQDWEGAARLREQDAAIASDERSRRILLFEAAQLYDRARNSSELLRLISEMDPLCTTPADRWHLRVLQARWHLLRNEPLLALARLQTARPAAMPSALQLYSGQSLALAMVQLQDGVAAVQALIDAAPGLTPSQEEQRLQSIGLLIRNRDLFWITPPGTVSSNLQAWLELGNLARRLWSTEAELDSALQNWAFAHPGHPGIRLQESLRADAAQIILSAPRKVAVLLPLSGRLGEVGEAIRDGFVAGYMDSGESGLQIGFFDTEALGATGALDSALAGQSDLIIGPLRKEAVVETLQRHHGVPQLALNDVLGNGVSRPWLLTLALPPEDDAEAAARLAMLQGHERVAMLRGSSTWAERSASAFADELAADGGFAADSVTFQSRTDSYPEAVKSLLQLERSQDRAARVQHALGRSIHYDLQRRQDIDALYLAADAADARQLRPQIRFFQGSDLPIYASGRLFAGDRSKAERDLEGVYFCSSPWLLGSTEGWVAQRSKFAQLAAASDARWARFHAVGMDAFQLITRVRNGVWQQGESVSGASGELTIEGERVARRLSCAVYRNGLPEFIATP